MTTISSQAKAMRLASFITAANVLVASGYSIAGLISPESILPANSVPTKASFIFAMYAASRTIPLDYTRGNLQTLDVSIDRSGVSRWGRSVGRFYDRYLSA